MKALLKGYFRYLYGSVTRGYERALLALLEKNPNAVLVDAGCWDGSNTVSYGRAVGAAGMIGLDVVEAAASKARERGVKVIICDLNGKIPLKPAMADVVVANHVIEHLYNVGGFLGELYRILKPGGYIILGTPNLASWHNIFALLMGRQPYSGPTVQFSAAKASDADSDFSSEMKREKSLRLLSGIGTGADAKTAEGALGHIVVLTYNCLVKLLESRGFVIEKSVCFGYHPFPPFVAKVLAGIDKAHSHYVVIKAIKPAKPAKPVMATAASKTTGKSL
ncbi:class I SAM-dependent methyltransferase [Candidatus Woesearchaeota archaeon]|nr:class I SAM-dependent methyltransferase [Candidatus Woesearchaeota archaeon]